MTRDAKGRFMSKRNRPYQLRYDDGTDEVVYALGPTEAVAARTRPLMPHGITDLAALDAWVHGQGPRVGIHTTPMLDRIYGPAVIDPDGWDRA